MLRPHLKPSNQRHLPYSSAYSASKRALAPVPPLPTLTATIPPPIPPHRLEVLTRPREATSSPPPPPPPRSPGPHAALVPVPILPHTGSHGSDEPTSVLAHIIVVDVVDLLDFDFRHRGARRYPRAATSSPRRTPPDLLGSLFLFFSPSQRSSQTPSCSLRVFLPNLHYP